MMMDSSQALNLGCFGVCQVHWCGSFAVANRNFAMGTLDFDANRRSDAATQVQ